MDQENQGSIGNSIDSGGDSTNLDDRVAFNSEKKMSSSSRDVGDLNADIESLSRSDGVANRDKREEFVEETSSSGVAAGIVLERVVVVDSDVSEGAADVSNQGLRTKDESRVDSLSREIERERGESEPSLHAEQRARCHSRNSVAGAVIETVVVMKPDESGGVSMENQDSDVISNDSQQKTTTEKSKSKVAKGQKPLHLADPKLGGDIGGGLKENCDGERVCRICHLSSEVLTASPQPMTGVTAPSMDLIQLGCDCKDELGIAHIHCAESWFKLKGNRICEICGEMAKNVTVERENRFREEWNQRMFMNGSNGLSERGAACWRGQPFCNFLMACLVIAFVLPWFFRVNMF